MTQTTRSLGCLILFALPFTLGGLLVGGLAGRMLWTYWHVQNWVEVPAKIISADLETHTGDDSTTYEVIAQYQYKFDGVKYSGDRVGLGSGADNIGSFHQDKYQDLLGHLSTGEPARCLVDPSDPASAILYPEMRWGLLLLMSIFSLLFTGTGIGITAMGFWGRKRVEADEALTKNHPDQPWRWKSAWAEGRITASGKAQLLMPVVMAVFWNLISFPLIFLLWEEVFAKENRVALIALVFPAVGVLLAVWAVRAFLHWRRFGDSVFEMSSFPGVLGGPLAGRILTSVDLNPADGFQLTLNCVRRTTTGSGKNRSTTERIEWQQERRIAREELDYDPTRSSIPVLFAVPHDAAPSEERSSDDETLWRLEVKAEIPGVDYATHFEVPIFYTPDSRTDFELEESELERIGVVPDRAKISDAAGIERELLSTGGWRIFFGAARRKGAALSMTMFLALWLGFFALLVHFDAPLLFPVLWGLFAVLLLLGVLDMWFERRAIEIHTGRLVLSGGIFGLGRLRVIQRQEIQEIRPVRGMQVGNKLYYRIVVTTRDGKKHVAATKLESLTRAQMIIDQMNSS